MKKHKIPLYLIAASASASIWSNWVELGKLAGFGPVHPLPGIVDDFEINTAITLPLGVEAYAFYAMSQWLTERTVPGKARKFAKWSSLIAGGLGIAGSVAAHVLIAQGAHKAPLPITIFVSTLPVIVFLLTGLLSHLLASAPDEQPAAHAEQGEQVDLLTAPEAAHELPTVEQAPAHEQAGEQEAAHELPTVEQAPAHEQAGEQEAAHEAEQGEQAGEQAPAHEQAGEQAAEQVPSVDEQVEQIFAAQAADLREQGEQDVLTERRTRDELIRALLTEQPELSDGQVAEQVTAQGHEVSRTTVWRLRRKLAA